MYTIIGNTLKYYSKEKNGDHFRFEHLENEGILIALVADGVSKQPCDWYASQLTCYTFIETFRTKSNVELSARILETMVATNNNILKTEGACERMNTTLSVVVWDHKKQRCMFSNIGDSRIYKYNGDQIQQLTADDSINQTKIITTSIGRRSVDASYLTKAIGISSIDFTVEEVAFQPNDLLILASDGFYNARKSAFERDMLTLAKQEDLENAFQTHFSELEFSAKDDMTAVFIRNINYSQS